MNNSILYIRLLSYLLITGLMTFISIISDSKYDDFSQIDSMDWFIIIGKSLLPGFVTIKAYLDQSFSNFLKQEDNK